jgi:hypothetical protein
MPRRLHSEICELSRHVVLSHVARNRGRASSAHVPRSPATAARLVVSKSPRPLLRSGLRRCNNTRARVRTQPCREQVREGNQNAVCVCACVRASSTRAYVWNLRIKIAGIDQHTKLIDDLRHLYQEILYLQLLQHRSRSPYMYTYHSRPGSGGTSVARRRHDATTPKDVGKGRAVHSSECTLCLMRRRTQRVDRGWWLGWLPMLSSRFAKENGTAFECRTCGCSSRMANVLPISSLQLQ